MESGSSEFGAVKLPNAPPPSRREDDAADKVESYDADVAIVSCHGRGNWLACELASRSWRVSLLDISLGLEAGQAEDLEGPFGLFAARDLLPSQIPRQAQGQTHFEILGESAGSGLTSCPNGFVLWLKSGPIELSGPLTDFHLQKLKVAPAVELYLNLLPKTGPNARQINRAAAQLDKCGFQESWLAHFATQFAAPFISENHTSVADAHNGSRALDLKAPFWIRQVSQSSHEEALTICEQKGVKVRRRVSVQALRLGQTKSLLRSKAMVQSLELSSERANGGSAESKTDLKARAYVWMLSGDETKRLPELVTKTVFPNPDVPAAWYWTRYQMKLREDIDKSDVDQLPIFAVVIEDHDLAWTHSNAFVWRRRLERAEARPEFDVWVKLPVRAAGDLAYRREIGHEIERVMTNRMPLFEPKVMELAAMQKSIDPVRHGLKAEADIGLSSDANLTNLFLGGPETWTSLDGAARFRGQADILTELEKLKAQWLAAEAKAAAREKK